jgi:integrase/recombinase XerC
MDLFPYVEEFLDYHKYQRNHSDSTVYSYRFNVLEFFKWLSEKGIEGDKVRVREMDLYTNHLLKENGNSPATVNRKGVALKMFYKYLMRMEVVDKNPFLLFDSMRLPQRLPKVLNQEQQEALLNAALDPKLNVGWRPPCSNNSRRTYSNNSDRAKWLRERDYLLIMCLIDTGLRVAELCGIQVENLDLEDCSMRVVGKGNKERIVVFSDGLAAGIRDYLKAIEKSSLVPLLPSRGTSLDAVLKELGMKRLVRSSYTNPYPGARLKDLRTYAKQKIKPLPMKYLFFNRSGKPMSTRHVFRILKVLGEKIGIQGLHPHKLRHTHATNLRMKGGDLGLIQAQLGHVSIATTQIYAHLETPEFKSRMRALLN